MTEILRITRPAATAFHDEYVERSQPTIVSDGMTEWAAPSRWTDEYLHERVGASQVYIRDASATADTPKRQWKSLFRYQRQPMSDYLTSLYSDEGRHRYLGLLQIKRSLPQLMEDFTSPRFMTLSPREPVLWLGRGGHLEPLHFDPLHGVLAQVRGKKHVTLLPPSAYRAVDPFPLWHSIPPWFARGEPGDASGALEAVVGPGDMLFIPCGWWHQVRCLEPVNISVTHFYSEPLAEYLRRAQAHAWYRTALARIGFEFMKGIATDVRGRMHRVVAR